jgi:hypothetical protein
LGYLVGGRWIFITDLELMSELPQLISIKKAFTTELDAAAHRLC